MKYYLIEYCRGDYFQTQILEDSWEEAKNAAVAFINKYLTKEEQKKQNTLVIETLPAYDPDNDLPFEHATKIESI